MTNAILVMGAESSGNRLMLRILHAAGCAGNLNDDNSQDFDTHLPAANGTPIAWLKTFPHAQEYPDMDAWYAELRSAGYQVGGAVVMIRDWFPMLSSQVEARHAHDDIMCNMRSQGGLIRIFEGLHQYSIPFYTVTYSGLVHHTKPLLTWLLPQLDDRLQVPDIDICDGDAKWWGE